MPRTKQPAWLAQSSSPHYLERAWAYLQDREKQRNYVRSFSRSKRSKLHLPSSLSTENSALARYSVAFGCKPENSLYNRYLDVVPYDCNRLSPAGDGLRYVNASWMKEHSGNKSWIASQAPLPHTVHAFLSVILDAPRAPEASHETNICTIVQLKLEEENGIVKAQRYFPEQVGQAWTVAPETNISSPAIRVTVLERRTLEQINCVDTTIE